MTAALEAGVNTFLFREATEALAAEWQSLGRFRAIFAANDGLLTSGKENVGPDFESNLVSACISHEHTPSSAFA